MNARLSADERTGLIEHGLFSFRGCKGTQREPAPEQRVRTTTSSISGDFARYIRVHQGVSAAKLCDRRSIPCNGFPYVVGFLFICQ